MNEGFSAKSIRRRVPIVFAFGEFAPLHGAGTVADLPTYVEGLR